MYFAATDDVFDVEASATSLVGGPFAPFEADIVKRLQEVEQETCYLMRELPKASHLALCLSHYSALFERARARALSKVMHDSFRLWGFGGPTQAYVVVLKKTVYDAREGELSLDLVCGSKRVFTIAFSLLPGRLFQLKDQTVAVITRVQGIPNRRDLTRDAVRAMNDVFPSHALFAALKGVCEAFGVKTVVGCPSIRQIKFNLELEALFTSNYEEFFATVGAVQRADGYFEMALPGTERPLSEIKRGHRIRTRLKRAIKAQITASACAALRSDTEAAVIQFDHEDCTAKLLLEPSLDQADQEQVAALAA